MKMTALVQTPMSLFFEVLMSRSGTDTDLHSFCGTTSHLHFLGQQTGHTHREDPGLVAQAQLLLQSTISVQVNTWVNCSTDHP